MTTTTTAYNAPPQQTQGKWELQIHVYYCARENLSCDAHFSNTFIFVFSRTTDREMRMSESGKPHQDALFDEEIGNVRLIPYLVVESLIALSNIAINSFLIHLLRKQRRVASISQRFVLCLTISDTCVGITQIIYVFLRVLVDHIQGQFSTEFASVVYFLLFLFSPLSACLIIVIAADRYLHMQYLTKYNMVMTKRRGYVIVFLCFLINIGFAISTELSLLYGYFHAHQMGLMLLYILMISVVFLLYLRSYRSIRSRVKPSFINSVSEPGGIPGTRNRLRDPNQEFFKGMMYVMISLVICYIPFIIMTVVRSILHLTGHPINHTLNYALLWAYTLNFSNSSLNAIILIMLNRELKGRAFRMVRRTVTQEETEPEISRIDGTGARSRPSRHVRTI